MIGTEAKGLVGELINSSQEQKEEIKKLYKMMNFSDDELSLLDCVYKMNRYDFVELREMFPIDKKDEYLSICMKASNSRHAQEIIKDCKKKGMEKYISCFERFV